MKKRGIFSVLFALVLALGLILAMAVPAGAIAPVLEMVTQPGNTTAGQPIAGPPAVKALDINGDPVPGVEVTVSEIGHVYTFDSGILTQITGADGIATFDDLVINTPDTGYQLQFSAAGYGFINSNAFDVTPLNEVWVATTGDDGNPGTQAEPFATIQKGVDNVAGGGTVNVEAGTYNESNITIDDKSLTVQSVSGDWHDTTLNVTGSEGFMLEPFGGGSDQFHEDFTVSGLTINGGDFGIDIDGLAAGNTVTISNCHIYEAALVGIFGSDTLDGDIFIDNCVIGGNGWDDGSGGIQLATITGTLEITDSFIGGYWDGEVNYWPNSTNGIVLESIEADASVLIDNNTIAENSDYGIYVPGDTVAGELTITDNIIGAYDFDSTEEDAQFTGNGNWGIYIEYVATVNGVVTIEGNKLAENGSGICIHQNLGETTISNNYVGAWTQGTTTHNGNTNSGIIIDQTPWGSLLIQGNNISGNGFTGLHVANNDAGNGAVTIDGNTIDDNGTGGHGNQLSNVEYATISNNTITRHTEEGSPYSGIYLNGSSYNTISGNTINENDFGIYIDSNSYYNEVLDNTIQDNNIDGILVYGDDNYIAGNTISNNTGAILCGIRLTESAEDNVIHYNNITANTLGFSVGVQNDNTFTTVDAENNWWGDASGPYNETGNPDGEGDAVSDYVDYDPWLGQPWSNEVWVDDDYTPATPGWGVTHFDEIQDAIDAVFPGATVHVLAGEYEIGEPALEDSEDFSDYAYLADIWIYKDDLTLQAENPAADLADPWDPDEASVIVASGDASDVVNIAADNVTFDGFTVNGADYGAAGGVTIYDWWEDELYSDCAVTNNYITSNDSAGIYLEGNGHTISYNIITDNGTGIITDSTDGSSITIKSNEISDAAALIYLEGVVDGGSATISNNILYDCETAIYSPGETVDGSSVIIEDNEIYGAIWGIDFELVTGGSELTIQSNEIHDNDDGIYLDLVDEESTVAIQNNNIHDNCTGIYLDEVSADSTVAIVGNTITNNTGDTSGIHLGGDVDATSVRANFNNIVGNLDYGVCNDGSGTLNARNNWWGSADGPGVEGGDDVSENVTYDPWLTVPVIGAVSGTVGAGGTLDGSSETGAAVDVTSGSATVTAVKYDGNPTTGSFTGGTGQYVDINLIDVTPGTEIMIKLYYTDADIVGLNEASLRLKWWDGDSWEECSEGGVNPTDIPAPPPAGAPYSGYMWARITDTSSPSVSELFGTAFGGGGTAGGGGGGGGGGALTTTLSKVGSVSLPPYLDWQGRTKIKIILTSDDGVLTIIIFSDTLVHNVEGNPLESMGIVTLSTPPPPPGYVLVGHAYDCIPGGASFAPNVTMTFAYDPADIPGGVSENDLLMAYWDGEEWINLPTTINATENTATTGVEHFTPFALIAYTGLVNFSASNLSIQPLEVQPQEEVTITLSVANTGDSEGSYNVVLKINGATEAEKSLTVAAGERQDVSFSVTREEAGSYSVDVNGLTGSFTVVAPTTSPAPEAPEAKPPINWMWIGIIAAAVVVVGLIIFFAVRRRAY